MGIRNALQKSRVVTFGVLFAIVWTLLATIEVATATDWLSWSTDYVGQNSVAGIIGFVVLAVSLGLLVTLSSETAESEPTPEPWPPE
ncbi:MAG: hypothetical protein ABEJ68_05720 [Halobacteriaceae archaeon]